MGSPVSTQASADSAARVSTALTFLNSYVANCNKMKDAVGFVDWVAASPLATQHLKAEIKRLNDEAYKREPIVGLDADPILDAQFFPDKGFEFDSIDYSGRYLYFKGKDMPEFTLCTMMIKENGKWMVEGSGIVNIPKGKRAKR